MVQSIYMQYMTRYFIKFGNHLDGFSNIFSLCNILLQVIYSHELNILLNLIPILKKSFRFLIIWV
jgi:hypothetical protein